MFMALCYQLVSVRTVRLAVERIDALWGWVNIRNYFAHTIALVCGS